MIIENLRIIIINSIKEITGNLIKNIKKLLKIVKSSLKKRLS